MPASFDLLLAPNAADFTTDLRLLDADGSQLAYQRIDFKELSASHRDGLFNLRHHLELLVEDAKQADGIDEVGVCIAQEVLGMEIFELLAASMAPRTLRILLPDARADNPLAAYLARVPWEIARRAAGQPTLAKHNLNIRVINSRPEPRREPLGLAPGEAFRVLFVFAEARGSRPLEARRERRELLHLFKTKIYPKRRVVAHFLSHGVTRERLETQVRENSGYHLVHWSGHGSQNQLELARPGGGADYLTGTDLLDLFNNAGGRLPQLIFLSACNSGEVLRVQDWQDLLAVAQGQRPVSAGLAPAAEAAPAATQLGYTGTAHALLSGGVPAVVAMRYAVGDTYARELGLQFYDALLAYEQPQPVAAALLTARQQLSGRADQSLFAPCDHATPVLYGAGQPDLASLPGRSPALSAYSPRLGPPVPELTIAEHPHFVGRTWELAALGADFIGTGAGVKPVAVVTGLGGMGKTALAAEALDLWERRFSWVLLYQAKPGALSLELTLRDMHLKLVEESETYRTYVRDHPTEAIHREPTDTFTGASRLERLGRNLVRALQDEPILLVLDNFEANLKPTPEPGPGAPRWACQDPAWDRCLAQLAIELSDSPSRVLLTSRWPLAALATETCCLVPLGPLPASEAALYVRSHPGLLAMALSPDRQEAQLVERLINASRLHPLLLDRLARLATGGPALRPQLVEALAALETSHDYSQLPLLFAVERGNKQEVAYLENALATSLDLLIEQAGPDARRLLWLIAIANEPVTFDLLDVVWRGESPDYQQQWQIKEMLANIDQLPPETQAQLRALPPERRAELDALRPLPSQPPLKSLLNQLLAVGLVTEERTGPGDDNPTLTCHELVRERIRAWLAANAQQTGQTENAIRLAYAIWLEKTCKKMIHQNMALAAEAGKRAIVYYIQAQAYEHLDILMSLVITSGSDTRLLQTLIPHLEQAVQAVPGGRAKYVIYGHLADILYNTGHSARSLPYYKLATALARAAAEASEETDTLGWKDLSWLVNNWAIALSDVGELELARQQFMESAKAGKKARQPAIDIIAAELGALRLDVMQGKVEAVRINIEARLAQTQAWWQRRQAGQPVPEAPNDEFLIRTLIGTLDIANDVDRARGDWVSALNRTDAILEIEFAIARPAEQIAGTLMNRSVELRRLGRFQEAQTELEQCFLAFEHNPGKRAKALNALALIFGDQGDFSQAITQARRALLICDQLQDPADRATSHSNLASYLRQTGVAANFAEAMLHQLAALLYQLVTGLSLDLNTSFNNYISILRRANATSTPPPIPRITDLLVLSAFLPLAEWLRERQVDLAKLQTQVDDFLNQARQAAADNS